MLHRRMMWNEWSTKWSTRSMQRKWLEESFKIATEWSKSWNKNEDFIAKAQQFYKLYVSERKGSKSKQQRLRRWLWERRNFSLSHSSWFSFYVCLCCLCWCCLLACKRKKDCERKLWFELWEKMCETGSATRERRTMNEAADYQIISMHIKMHLNSFFLC